MHVRLQPPQRRQLAAAATTTGCARLGLGLGWLLRRLLLQLLHLLQQRLPLGLLLQQGPQRQRGGHQAVLACPPAPPVDRCPATPTQL